MAKRTPKLRKVFSEEAPTSGSEANLRQKIAEFFRAELGPERSNEVELEYPTGDGPCDLFISSARVVLEAKAPRVPCRPFNARGNAETQFDQVQRYLCALRKTENESATLSDDSQKVPWTSILTNGKVWWAWEYSASSESQNYDTILEGNKYDVEIDKFLREISSRKGGKPWIPSDPKEVLKNNFEEFSKVFADAKNLSSSNRLPAFLTQMDIWKELLLGSGIEIATNAEELYKKHVLLLVVARAVVRLYQGKGSEQELLENSYGSWLGETSQGKQWLEQLCAKVDAYNWRARKVDVLRNLYQSLIPKQERKLYGEYYTPDWLAEMICEEMLDDEWLKMAIKKAWVDGRPPDNVGVLDPTCGSGTFLYHAARRISNAIPHVLGSVASKDRGRIVANLVCGIDIHPVAVEMARATFLRALPPDAGFIEPMIYQGDALLARRQKKIEQQFLILGENEALFKYPRDSKNTFSIPYSLFDQENMASRLQWLVDSAKNRSALRKGVTSGLSEQDARILEEAYIILAKIIKKHGNGVWTWYIRNQLAPYAVYRRKVDRIVSNPPWVRFSEIQVQERKDDIKRMALNNELWAGGRNATGYDIGGLFSVQTRNLYLAKGGKGAYVLHRGVLAGKHWASFRDKRHDRGMLDLKESHADGYRLTEKPFSVDACVIGLSNEAPERLVLVNTEDRIDNTMSWSKLKPLVRRVDAEKKLPRVMPSVYAKNARQGATISPAVLLRIDPMNPNQTYQPSKAKFPWKGIRVFQIEDIPAHWRKKYLEPENLVAFGINEPLSEVIVPTDETGKLLTDKEARDQSPRTWRNLSDTYEQHRGTGASTPRDLLAQINYSKKWSSQFPLQTSVIYNGSGSRLRAAVTNYPIEHKLYRITLYDDKASYYLCAMLNAESLKNLYFRARNSDRHFLKTPLEKIPIPSFVPANNDHLRLAECSELLHQEDNQNDEALLKELSELARQVILSVNVRFKDFMD